MKWTKKPVTIEAAEVQHLLMDAKYNWEALPLWVKENYEKGNIVFLNDSLIINTLEGNMTAVRSDFLIQGVNGEIYPCKRDIFFKTYEQGPSKDKEVENVRTFYKKFDILTNEIPTMVTKRKLKERIECMQEELDEFRKAVDEQNFEDQADALIDLVYFAKGTAVQMGLPWAELWDDVQRANMTKVRGVGKRGHAVDMIKPEGWQGPKTGDILKLAGFHKVMFTCEDGTVDEDACADDAFRKVQQQKFESDSAE